MKKLWNIWKSFDYGRMFPILYTIRDYREKARGKNVLQTEQKKKVK